MDEEQPKPNLPAKKQNSPLTSVLYSCVHMAAVMLNIHVILPMVLKQSWSGTLTQHGIFVFAYILTYTITTYVFLAVAGYLGIMLVVAKNLKKFSMADVQNENVAKAIAMHVLMGNQPRWLISLAPAVVPAVSFAILAQFFKEQLPLTGAYTLLQACLLQGVVSFVLSLPFILKTQKSYDFKAVLEEKLKEKGE